MAPGRLTRGEVARLGGRPSFTRGLDRMIDLNNTNVTDKDMSRYRKWKGFASSTAFRSAIRG